jgi:translation initiation factor 3 subunit D
MVDFVLPKVYNNDSSWGPPNEEVLDSFNVAYEHLDKYTSDWNKQKIGKICDFTITGMKWMEQRNIKGKGTKGKGKTLNTLGVSKDDEGFAVVDHRPLPSKTFSRGRGGYSFGRGKGKGKGLQGNYQEGILGQKLKPSYSTNLNQTKGKGKGNRAPQRRGAPPSFKEWSVVTKAEWTLMREIPLWELGKLTISDAKDVKIEDMSWRGKLHTYNKDFDRITLRTEKVVKRYEELNFFNVTTFDDPVLTQMMTEDEDITVIATDYVLAALIAAARSVYSWDLVITKQTFDGRKLLLIDKRDGSQIDFLSVNETADNAPNNDDVNHINSPGNLGREAGCINQNFSQMVLDYKIEPEEMDEPNPFEDESEGAAASGAFRYRKITIPGNTKDSTEFNQSPITLAVRTEVNCKVIGTDSKPHFATVKALNEYDPKANYSWRKHLETQAGAVMATELKNNAFKLGRWTAQAILGGCEVMKIGYVARTNPTDPWTHSALNVATHVTDRFAEQIGMHRNNIYGIIRNIVNLVMTWDDGKYLLIKDPIKSYLRFYAVPWETFDADEEGDEEDDEDDDAVDLDEDGNVKPEAPHGPNLG